MLRKGPRGGAVVEAAGGAGQLAEGTGGELLGFRWCPLALQARSLSPIPPAPQVGHQASTCRALWWNSPRGPFAGCCFQRRSRYRGGLPVTMAPGASNPTCPVASALGESLKPSAPAEAWGPEPMTAESTHGSLPTVKFSRAGEQRPGSATILRAFATPVGKASAHGQ